MALFLTDDGTTEFVRRHNRRVWFWRLLTIVLFGACIAGLAWALYTMAVTPWGTPVFWLAVAGIVAAIVLALLVSLMFALFKPDSVEEEYEAEVYTPKTA